MSSRNALMRNNVLQVLAFPSSVTAARTMATILGPLWAAALGANIVGAEYQYGTWPWLLVRNSSRARLMLVKILSAACRIIAITLAGMAVFFIVAAAALAVLGAPLSRETTTAGRLLIPFITVAGAMAFAAAVGLTITVVSRSVVFGTLTGVLMLPLLTAIRFKETAPWIPYVHLDNLQSRLMTGQPAPMLMQFYEFNMSGRTSAGILTLEMLIILGIAFVVFRRQEIVY